MNNLKSRQSENNLKNKHAKNLTLKKNFDSKNFVTRKQNNLLFGTSLNELFAFRSFSCLKNCLEELCPEIGTTNVRFKKITNHLTVLLNFANDNGHLIEDGS